MTKEKTLAFIGAHPDDESFGPGGTLAKYAAAGMKVYVVCSTGGEAGTVAPHHLKGHNSIAELRANELACAADALGLTGVVKLGYRDSGMRGSAENSHSDCMAMAPMDDVVRRIVKVIREIRPDVIITHDPSADYGHPDHVATHKGVVQAFRDAGDPSKYPSAGPPFKPSKLYFGVRPHGTMKWIVRFMPLFGQDPHHFGRNKDIDLTRMVRVEYPVHAVVRLSKADVAARRNASLCHSSQGGGLPRRGPFRVLQMIDSVRGPRDYFMRAYPETGRKEKDLFQGI